ncbi:MAG TPA: alkaline phosphatase family protein [Acidimicrobiia bacterium]|nr:alkaline phosphatase family protein [Acidimicrobiia bacterium]
MEKRPSYLDSGLGNLVAEIELRLTGESPSPGLAQSGLVPAAATYVLVLFDGLGVAQLQHAAASPFRTAHVANLDAPFPTMTNVSLATVATALPPAQHGQVAHLTWYPDLDKVVNTLKWVTLGGEPVKYDYAKLLPRPNLWERLRSAGIEPITVQPSDFQRSPLTREMYRGARFEGAWDAADLASATLALAAEPGRLIFTYVPFVDFAGHVFGQGSAEFSDAMTLAASIWETIVGGLPPGAAVVGTADHGLMEVAESDKILVRDPQFDDLRKAGDPRGVQLWGDEDLIADLVSLTGGSMVDPTQLLGPDLSDVARSRLGEKLLLAPPGKVVLPRGFDRRLRCYHGGLSPEEMVIPLLVG